MKTEGAIQQRSRAVGKTMFWVVIALLLAVTLASFFGIRHTGAGQRPDFFANYQAYPALFAITLFGAASVVVMWNAHRQGNDRLAFMASAGLIIGILASVGAGLYPYLLPSNTANPGLTIYNAKSADSSQRIAFFIYLAGISIVSVYMVYVYRIWGGKVDEHGGYHA